MQDLCRSGGIQGGLSNGELIVAKIAFKPTSPIARKQNTVSRTGESVELLARGRHDPCVVPRAVPMVEAMAALVLADQLLQVMLALIALLGSQLCGRKLYLIVKVKAISCEVLLRCQCKNSMAALMLTDQLHDPCALTGARQCQCALRAANLELLCADSTVLHPCWDSRQPFSWQELLPWNALLIIRHNSCRSG